MFTIFYAQFNLLNFRLIFSDYKKSHDIVRQVKAAEEFVLNHRDLFNEEEVEERRSYTYDLKVCFSSSEFEEQWSSFKEDLSNDPAKTLNCLGLAAHQVINKNAVIFVDFRL